MIFDSRLHLLTSASLLALYLAASPVSAQTSAPAPAAPVIVKPLELPPKVIELPQSAGRLIDDFIKQLGKHVEGLETNHGDVADCVETYRNTASEPRAITVPAYYECLAKASANTRSIWLAAAGSFRDFATNLSSLEGQIGEVKHYVDGQQQEVGNQLRVLQRAITEGRTKLQQVQAALARGQTLNAEQGRQVRILVDNVTTAHLKAQMLKGRQTFFDQARERLDRHATNLANLRGEVGVMEHLASNRTELWAAFIENIRSQGTIATLDANLAELRSGVEKLGPMIETLDGLLNFRLPELPAADGTAVAPSQLPAGNLRDLLSDVLKRTE